MCNSGPCFENNNRRIGANESDPRLECDDDSGEFEPRQNDERDQWCVFPENGTEIPNTRRNRSMTRPDCARRGKFVYI